MHIGNPWQGQGITLYAIGVGTDSIRGCWYQMGQDSSDVGGAFRLDLREGFAK
jgi:hypothetical protein